MQTAAVRAPVVASAQQQKAAPKAAVAALPRVAKALGAGVASLALALSANAATVKSECGRAAASRPRGLGAGPMGHRGRQGAIDPAGALAAWRDQGLLSISSHPSPPPARSGCRQR